MYESEFVFSLENVFTKQKKSAEMGKPFAVLLVNLFMEDSKVKQKMTCSIFRGFDTNMCDVKEFVNSLKFTSIQFTYELEYNGELPVLDVLVLRILMYLENIVVQLDIYVMTFLNGKNIN